MWFDYVITDEMQRIRAHLELRRNQFEVHANSAVRFERVLATVRTLDPSVTVLSGTREPGGTFAPSGNVPAATNRANSSTRRLTRPSLRPSTRWSANTKPRGSTNRYRRWPVIPPRMRR